jgi:LysR family glycine cleavage system transcriptional activator
MAQLLPPLAAVRAFEAAARLGSFTRAADELGMTQAAVSYQIKLLEERVGAPLFLRQPRQVVLTETGRRLSAAVTDAFDALRAAFADLHEAGNAVLTISATHAFASNWLAPRLGTFQLAHPDLAVRLSVSDHLTDFAREEVDVAIRHGRGPWPGLAMHRLFPIRFAPMCSPELLRREGPLATPADLLRLPLLSPTDPWWREWFELAGVEAPGLEARAGVALDSQQIEGRAALAGQGVAILTPVLWADELQSGRLVQPFALAGDNGRCYWLVYPEARRQVAKVRTFRGWLLAEVARFEAAAQVSAAPAPESRSSPPR